MINNAYPRRNSKSFFITVFGVIKKIITLYFTAYFLVIKTVFTAVKAFVGAIWNGIKAVISKASRGIKSVVSSAWRGIKSVTSSVFGSIRSIARSLWSGIKYAVTTPAKAIRNIVSSIWHGIKSTTISVWNSIKSAIISPVTAAKNAVRNIINAIKGFFNFHISWPNIPLPHFSISPSGWKLKDLLKGTIPHLGISWYAEGGILKKPTIFGRYGSTLLGGGEAGYEAVAPINTLKGYVRDAVKEAEIGNSQVFNITMTVNGAIDPKSWASEFASSLKRKMRMGGI